MKPTKNEIREVFSFIIDFTKKYNVDSFFKNPDADTFGDCFRRKEKKWESSGEAKVTCGLTKAVLINNNGFGNKYVIKIPFVGREKNYCESEKEITETLQDISLSEISQCFAHSWKIGTFLNSPIYLMERADVNTDKSKSYSEQVRFSDNDKFYTNSSILGAKSFFDDENFIDAENALLFYYGANVFDMLCDFCNQNDINDVHIANIGYIEDRPVLIDYSGYIG